MGGREIGASFLRGLATCGACCVRLRGVVYRHGLGKLEPVFYVDWQRVVHVVCVLGCHVWVWLEAKLEPVFYVDWQRAVRIVCGMGGFI